MLNSIKLSLIEKSSFKLHFSKLASNVLYHAFSTSTTNLNDNNNEHKKEETMHEIRARIFGYHIGNGLRSGRKILKKAMIGPRIANYYLKPIKDPLMMDIVQERSFFIQNNL